ncbi:class II fructose-bisphosphate aldolase [Rhodococcus xishaensis]|uniref:Fructose-bisphosphate aldolase n=1 Tax=Rhodococcus xishaensis TaxID=2487364 RepID=A0A438ANQ9_9NOCA|nr:class II fructose-bisphosphate aldolase [Rhodococcus xishaensis]RVW00181.1 fructose-bisphosphate aldolase [Rhodococcus xishaensis]
MTLAKTSELVRSAVSAGGAVVAFNVITLEHAEGIAEGVERAGARAVLQISENAVRFHRGRIEPILAGCAQVAAQSSARLAIHLDHFEDLALTERVICVARDLGASSIMVDAARLDHDQNVAQTRELAKHAHLHGLWVEAELGEIGGKDGAHAPGVRTDPIEAREFVERTCVDGLAVAVGSSHAMTTKDAQIDTGLIEKLRESVPVPLVLHGSSGVDDSRLAEAVRAGIRKVNVGTALNIGFTQQIREFLGGNPETTDPRRYLDGARSSISDSVAHLCAVVAEATSSPQAFAR